LQLAEGDGLFGRGETSGTFNKRGLIREFWNIDVLVYLPEGDWFDFWTSQRQGGLQHVLALAGLDTIPLFVREGAILPLGPIQQYVGEKPSDTIELHIWPGATAELRWYEDDGESMAHEREVFCKRVVTQATTERGALLRLSEVQGRFASKVKTWRIVLHGIGKPCGVTVNGILVQTQGDLTRQRYSIDVPNQAGEIEIKWQWSERSQR